MAGSINEEYSLVGPGGLKGARWARSLGVAVAVAATVLVAYVRSDLRHGLDEEAQAMWKVSRLNCQNGDPGTASNYGLADWGTLDGTWYAVARNQEPSPSFSCEHTYFDIDKRLLTYSDTYTEDGVGKMTSNYTMHEFKKTAGKFWGSVDDWASVFVSGTYRGERYFGWYMCEPFEEKGDLGIATIYKENGPDVSDDFLDNMKKKLRKKGLLEYGDFWPANNTACD